MSSADREQKGDSGGREKGQGPSVCELRSFAHPVDEALLLAAVERAERHRGSGKPGVMLGDCLRIWASSTTARRHASCVRIWTRWSRLARSIRSVGSGAGCSC
jgi:hypothetical protein